MNVARDDEERAALRAARRAALPSMARLRPITIVEDTAVPRGEIARMLAAVDESFAGAL